MALEQVAFTKMISTTSLSETSLLLFTSRTAGPFSTSLIPFPSLTFIHPWLPLKLQFPYYCVDQLLTFSVPILLCSCIFKFVKMLNSLKVSILLRNQLCLKISIVFHFKSNCFLHRCLCYRIQMFLHFPVLILQHWIKRYFSHLGARISTYHCVDILMQVILHLCKV